jgi:hypothetical protein
MAGARRLCRADNQRKQTRRPSAPPLVGLRRPGTMQLSEPSQMPIIVWASPGQRVSIKSKSLRVDSSLRQPLFRMTKEKSILLVILSLSKDQREAMRSFPPLIDSPRAQKKT